MHCSLLSMEGVVTCNITSHVLPPQSGITLFVSDLACNAGNASSSVPTNQSLDHHHTFTLYQLFFQSIKIVPFLISWIMDVCLIKCETEKSSQSIWDWPPVSGGVSHLTPHTLPLPDCHTLPLNRILLIYSSFLNVFQNHLTKTRLAVRDPLSLLLHLDLTLGLLSSSSPKSSPPWPKLKSNWDWDLH